MAVAETFRPAFTQPPGTSLAGIPTKHLKLSTPWLSYGLPYDEACAKHIQETFQASRVYVVVSKSLAASTDRLERLISTIGTQKVVGVRKGITPHTPWSEILEITAECSRTDTDCIVTLGAGSITDACKIVVLALANNISEPEQLSRCSVESKDVPDVIKEPTVPLITIPTSLSGGEYFSLAGGTDDSTKHKHAFMHSGMGSKLIILDPELCLSTPEYHWLSTGVRSVDHCVEALCSLESTEQSDKNAEEGLKLLVPSLLRCKANGKDVEARHNCQMAVCLAMENVRSGIPMGGSHAIGHQLGPLGVPHGITSCIMCPAVMKYNFKHADGNRDILAKQKTIQDILWSEPEVVRALREAGLNRATTDLGDSLDAIIRALGLPRSLSEMGIDLEVLPKLSKRTLDDIWAATNPVPLVKAEQVQEILEMVV